MTCPYCHKPAKFCENKEIYGKNYGASFMCYYCKDCDASVGVHHNDPARPLGTMANKELKKLRIMAHDVIDVFWRPKNLTTKQVFKRGHVYSSLNKLFDKEIHVGESDEDTCRQIIASKDKLRDILIQTKYEPAS